MNGINNAVRRIAVIGLVMTVGQAVAAGLDAKDREAIKLAKTWMHHPAQPMAGDSGRVVFAYGESLPTVVCAPLRVCDMALEAGEKVKSVKLGDTIRWKVSPAKSGPEDNETTHVIIKPTQAGLETTMMLGTDRRTYHVRLVSDKHKWMPYVGFQYPEEAAAAWAALAEQEQAHAQRASMRSMSGVELSVDQLNFSYAIDGQTRWRPTRVFDDGTHTYIDLPDEAAARDAPILLVKNADGERLVNYRVKGTRFVVDGLFDEAVLVAGVGSNQEKITLRRASE